MSNNITKISVTPLWSNRQQGAVLIVGVILTLVASLLAITAMKGSTFQESMTSNINSKANAFLAAELGATAAVKWIQDNPGQWGETVVVNNQQVAGGSQYSYSISYTVNEATIIADGFVAGTEARAQVEAVFSKSQLAATPMAAVTCFGPECSVAVGGSMAISGFDHDLPNSFNCTGNKCKGSKIDDAEGAIGVDIPDGGGSVSGTVGGNNEGKGIHGNPPVRNPSSGSPVDVGEHNASYWKDKATDLMTSSEAVTVSPGASTSNLGTRADPKVTVLTDGSKINASTDGAGVLIVEAGAVVTYNGNFHFEGLIILMPGAELKGNGTATILGGIVGVSENGEPIAIGQNGNFDVQYSTAAFTNALGGESGISAWTPVESEGV